MKAEQSEIQRPCPSVAAVRARSSRWPIAPGGIRRRTATPIPQSTALTKPTSTIEVGRRIRERGLGQVRRVQRARQEGRVRHRQLRPARRGATTATTTRRAGSITGTDLGLDTRSLTAEYGEQGKFRSTSATTSCSRNRSDTYQTPVPRRGRQQLHAARQLDRAARAASAAAPRQLPLGLAPPGLGARADRTASRRRPRPRRWRTVNNIIATDVPPSRTSTSAPSASATTAASATTSIRTGT